MDLQTTIRAISGAYEQIDHAISEALYQSKPVLIQVASNMASLTHPLFEEQPVPFSMTGKTTNEVSVITRQCRQEGISQNLQSQYDICQSDKAYSAECVHCVRLYYLKHCAPTDLWYL